jgi:dipeptidyl aminopeptidase/acylaminoacyl peptidase
VRAESAPFGAWTSPVTATLVASGGVRLSEVRTSGPDVYWLESRAAEGGRGVVVRRDPSGAIADVTPEGCYARTLAHEYGGGTYAVSGSTVFFSNFADQRVYRQRGAEAPVPITPEPEQPRGVRYADFECSPDGRWLFCVRETHAKGREASNEVVALATDGSGDARVISTGHDFVAFPRLDPEGRQLSWTSWEHPRMPWDGTELWLADLTPDAGPRRVELVAGGAAESVFQPSFGPDGSLHFVTDRSGWWNLYCRVSGETRALAPLEAEFGRPQWAFATATYAFLGDGRIVCIWISDGLEHIGVLDGSHLREIETPYSSFGRLERLRESRVALTAASPSESPAVVALDPDSGEIHVLKRSRESEVDARYVSVPRAIEFPTSQDRTAHALFYAPANPDFDPPAGERPPLLVFSHGGPTGATSSALNLGIQFWTSRGFAVVDVNYGGSTGYGRQYRERLRGSWGIVDTEDCIHAARYLADRNRVDPDRMAIRGGSAGGYTTLCALTFHDLFAAGASYFGVADAEALAADTHKFESRYLDSLIGPYPEARDLYRARSPIHFADRLSCPLLILQGLEDEIVPPAQAEVLVEALRARGLPYAYLPFEGEQHGFRRAENIIRSLEAELYFYGRIFGFEPADSIEPLEIANLQELSQSPGPGGN